MLNRLTDSLDFQTQALSLRSERQRVLASNIANADTPGYQARDMNFADALRAATSGSTSGQLAQTQAGHMSAPGGATGDTALVYSLPAQTNLDSNTVDMDRERANFADNAIKYQAALTFIGGQVRTTLDAMKPYNSA